MVTWIPRRLLATGAVWLLAGLLAGGCGTGEGTGQTGTTAQVRPGAASPTTGVLPAVPAPPTLGRKTSNLLLDGQSDTTAPRPDPGGTLNLERGWNLVSWGVAHLDRVDTNADVHPTLFVYDPARGGYQSVNLNASAINAAGATRGFWAYANRAVSLQYDGTGGVTAAPLQAGWNMVGMPGLPVSLGQTEASAQSGGSSLPLPQVVSPENPPPAGSLAYAQGFSYSPSAGNYQTVNLANPGTRTATGRAIWVYAFAAGSISWLPGPTASGIPGAGPPASGPDQPPPAPPDHPGPPPAPPAPGPTP